eukprot:1160590-Pelagomonas_calceolata.AAC.17
MALFGPRKKLLKSKEQQGACHHTLSIQWVQGVAGRVAVESGRSLEGESGRPRAWPTTLYNELQWDLTFSQ